MDYPPVLNLRQLDLGGGWLAQAGLNWGLGHGAVDFAGSGVVFAMAGVIALGGCMLVGPRAGSREDDNP